MKISALDLKRQIAPIRQEIDSAIKDVIDSASFILGKGLKNLRRTPRNIARLNMR